MTDILLVSKPVAPPWNDSSKNLVRDLARGMVRYEPVVMGSRDASWQLGHGRTEGIYPGKSGGFAPALGQQARVLKRLLLGRRTALWHFFFAPNPVSSHVGRGAARVRGMRTVHTVCSAPRSDVDPRRVVFADRTVVMSRHTEARLADAGVPETRLRRIPPGIAPLSAPDESARTEARTHHELPRSAPLVVYPGDLEFGQGASRVLEAFAGLRGDAHLVMACRAKTDAAAGVEQELREQAARRGLGTRVHWIGETRDIHSLLGAADVVLLPATDLYAKMDYPLAVLEAMSLARPVVVSQGTAAAELGDDGSVAVCEHDVDALRAVTEGLLDDDGGREELGRRARDALLRSYTYERMAEAYETLYDELLS